MREPTPADRIKARTDSDARKRFLRFLQASLSSVHPWAQWITAPVAPRPEFFNAFTNPGVLEFDSKEGRVGLQATLRFTYCDDERHPGERKVATGDYGYTITDVENREVLSWQWHPSVGEYDMPHLHVGRGLPGSFGKMHIPTGRVAFEDVLLFLIRDYDVAPQSDEAHAAIMESLRRFRDFRTWS